MTYAEKKQSINRTQFQLHVVTYFHLLRDYITENYQIHIWNITITHLLLLFHAPISDFRTISWRGLCCRMAVIICLVLNCAGCQPIFLLKQKAYQTIRLSVFVCGCPISYCQPVDQFSWNYISTYYIGNYSNTVNFYLPTTSTNMADIPSFEAGATEELCK
jgi:hypothetical protein